jgi:hypothetical protein
MWAMFWAGVRKMIKFSSRVSTQHGAGFDMTSQTTSTGCVQRFQIRLNAQALFLDMAPHKVAPTLTRNLAACSGFPFSGGTA